MKKARLIDVAKEAGVAPNTASTILNRRPNSWASKKTEQRVFDAAKKLGYRPNKAAVGLRLGKISTIGIVIPNIQNPFYAEFVDLLTLKLSERDYDCVIETSRVDPELEIKRIRDIFDRQIGGCLLALMRPSNFAAAFPGSVSADIPTVLLSGPQKHELELDHIMIDHESGIVESVDHLHELGHRRIAFLSTLPRTMTAAEFREQCFLEQISRLGVDPGQTPVIHSGYTFEETEAAFFEFLEKTSSNQLPTAVVCLNDIAALGAIRAATNFGLKVPEDLSVVGFDDTLLSRCSNRALTTVSIDIHQIVEKSVEFLMDRIALKEDEALELQKHCIKTTLTVRETTAPPQKQ